MNNLVKAYFSKSAQHLFTKDEKTFMRILLVHEVVLQIEFGAQNSVWIVRHPDGYACESSAGKKYLNPDLKRYLFPRWMGKTYQAVKGRWRSQGLCDQISALIEPEEDYSYGEKRQKLEEKIRQLIAEYDFEMKNLPS